MDGTFSPFSFSEKYFPYSKMKPQLKLETNEILLFLSFCRKKTLLHQLEPSIKNSFERVGFFFENFFCQKKPLQTFLSVNLQNFRGETETEKV